MILKTEKVIKEWTDYNGHLNVAFYVHVFDIAADIMLDNFKEYFIFPGSILWNICVWHPESQSLVWSST